MTEETRWCRICRKEKPNDVFRAPEGAGKDFYKMCEPCRTKYKNRSRVKRARANRGRAWPHYLSEPAPQTSIDLTNSETRVTPETTSAAQTTPMPEQPNCMHADSGHHSRVTVAPPVVESSAQSTTTTTVITISTTTVSKNGTETSNKPAEDAKTAQDGIQQVKDEDLESLSSGPESEQQGEIGAGTNQRPEFFGCLHCEKLRPWPMAGLHICLLCIRDWKWCAKGAHNQAKASFIWDGEEHNECYMCHFAGI
ncbi:hypothetical protein N7449_010879 [Penicillium cf. viridicatum]|uniref:Uncharacterized protein n=1 Tax=Penicillium cf. viridicatum TaxID=2972119 RepID=A0A9W9M3K0_9EURO|nr:hypothetical protein N7449_010879 [Penicillium cf. viridicatum]